MMRNDPPVDHGVVMEEQRPDTATTNVPSYLPAKYSTAVGTSSTMPTNNPNNSNSNSQNYNSHHEPPTNANYHHNFQQQHQSSSREKSSVQVAVRIRPILSLETGNDTCINVFSNDQGSDRPDTIIKSSSSETNFTYNTALSTANGTEITQDLSPTSTTLPGCEEEGDGDIVHSNSYLSNTSTHHSSFSNTHQEYQTVQIQNLPDSQSNKPYTFTFDHVYSPSSQQYELYSSCVVPMIQSCLEGYNATVFAYGQTGSGKTHTILGDLSPNAVDGGVIPRALRDIFHGLEQQKQTSSSSNNPSSQTTANNNNTFASATKPSFEYQVKVQFLELYGELIQDLIEPNHSQDESSDIEDVSDHNLHRPKTTPISTPAALERNSSTSSFHTTNSTNNKSKNNKRKRRKTPLSLRDGKPGEDAEVVGINQVRVQSAEEALDYLQRGMDMRQTSKTAMNSSSSRSHAIFTLVIQQTRRKQEEIGENNNHFHKNGNETDGGDDDDDVGEPWNSPNRRKREAMVEMKTSKIHFVDLAGSERIKRSMTVGKRMQEGININKGLSVLGNVISALSSSKKRSHHQKKHIPYRDSKLTRLLKGSLGGNHKTLMIACVSPSSSNRDETINTLRYANRAKNIKNHAKVNVDPSSRVMNELKDQVVALAGELLRLKKSGTLSKEEESPFSQTFLEGLVSTSNHNVKWKQNHGVNNNPLTHGGSSTIGNSQPERPSTAPSTPDAEQNYETETEQPPPILNKKRETHASWSDGDVDNQAVRQRSRSIAFSEAETIGEEEESLTNYDTDTPPPSSTQAQDPNVSNKKIHEDEKIESYDFALAALREYLKAVAADPDDDSSSSKKRAAARIRHLSPGLGSLRSIDELYEYLNSPQRVGDEKGDKNLEEDGEESKRVLENHVSRLDESISKTENILNEMTQRQENLQKLRMRNEHKLSLLETKISDFQQEKEQFENVMNLFDERSVQSKGMTKSIKEMEEEIAQMQQERSHIFSIAKTADDNAVNMSRLKRAMLTLKRQRLELKRASTLSSDLDVTSNNSPTSVNESISLIESMPNDVFDSNIDSEINDDEGKSSLQDGEVVYNHEEDINENPTQSTHNQRPIPDEADMKFTPIRHNRSRKDRDGQPITAERAAREEIEQLGIDTDQEEKELEWLMQPRLYHSKHRDAIHVREEEDFDDDILRFHKPSNARRNEGNSAAEKGVPTFLNLRSNSFFEDVSHGSGLTGTSPSSSPTPVYNLDTGSHYKPPAPMPIRQTVSSFLPVHSIQTAQKSAKQMIARKARKKHSSSYQQPSNNKKFNLTPTRCETIQEVPSVRVINVQDMEDNCCRFSSMVNFLRDVFGRNEDKVSWQW